METKYYEVVSVEDELPENGKFYSVSLDGGESFPYEAKGKDWKAHELGYTHFLKPLPEDAVVISKKIIERLWWQGITICDKHNNEWEQFKESHNL